MVPSKSRRNKRPVGLLAQRKGVELLRTASRQSATMSKRKRNSSQEPSRAAFLEETSCFSTYSPSTVHHHSPPPVQPSVRTSNCQRSRLVSQNRSNVSIVGVSGRFSEVSVVPDVGGTVHPMQRNRTTGRSITIQPPTPMELFRKERAFYTF